MSKSSKTKKSSKTERTSKATESSSNVKLSIIIPCYNCAEYLDNSVGKFAALAEDFCKRTDNFEVELLVIEDASTDGGKTAKKCAKLADKFANINLIPLKENKGQAHARNVALKQALGQFITFADADDTIPDDYFEIVGGKLIDDGAENSGADKAYEMSKSCDTEKAANNSNTNKADKLDNSINLSCSSKITNSDKTEKTKKILHSTIFVFGAKEQHFDKDALAKEIEILPGDDTLDSPKEIKACALSLERKVLFGYLWNKIYPAALLKANKIKIPNEHLIEDHLFNLEAFKCAKQIVCTNKVIYYYARRSSDSVTGKSLPDYFEQYYRRVEGMYD